MAVNDRTTEFNINLEDEGIVTNSWVTLENAYARVGLYGNTSIYVAPKNIQFYFDTTNELVFVRYTKDNPRKLDSQHPLLPGYVSVPHNGFNYQIKLVEGGIKDSEIGVYHDVYSLDNIVGFFK